MDAQRGIARRMVVGLPPEGLTASWEKDFSAYPPAGVILFRRDFRDLEELRRLTSRLRELTRPRRLFISIDEEGGWVSQLDGHLMVPPNAALLARGAAPGDVAEAHRVTAMRLRSLGLDWVFAPVADVNVEPRNPVIGARAFGADADTVSRMLGDALSGLRAGGVASCLKHFPGHGGTAVDSHLTLPVCATDRATLDSREIAPFRAHLTASAIMTAHVVYPALDAASPGTFSRAIVTGLLRDTLGFEGVCITDALEMKGAAEGRGPYDSARMALEAGCDLLLFAFHSEGVRRARLELANALVDGVIDRASFDAARPRLEKFDREHSEPGPEDMTRPLDQLTPAGWRERIEAVIDRGLIVRGSLASDDTRGSPASDDTRGSLASGVARGAGPAAAARVDLPPAAVRGPWHVTEPEYARGETLAARLAAEGVSLTADPDAAAARVIAVASRVPLSADATAQLRAESGAHPTILVGLQNDAFLDDVPEAALRLSAADCTEPTRRVVARRLAELVGRGAASSV
ncbi:MAG: glycoside hydrolase family 3 N-terminal domain-containing protein [Candidatus Eisenbacteria bacterium]